MKKYLLFAYFLLAYCSLSGTNVQSLKDSLLSSKGLEKAEILREIGRYYYLHDHDSALFFVDLAIKGYETENMVRKVISSQLLKIAIFREDGLYDSAINLSYKAIDWARVNSDTLAAVAYFELANTYELMNNKEKAKLFYKKAINVKFKPIEIIAKGNLGNIFKASNDFDSAEYYWRHSLKMHLLLDTAQYANRFNIAVCRSNLGGLLFEIGDYIKGINIYKQNSLFFQESNNYPALILVYGKIARGYQMSGQNNIAIKYYRRAIQLADSLKLSQNLADAYNNISDYFVKNEDYKNAYLNYFEYHELNDSLIALGYNEKVAELETLYSLSEKVNKIKILKEERRFVYGIAASIIISIIFIRSVIVLLINRRRLKLQNAKALSDAKSKLANYRIEMAEKELKEVVASLHKKSAFIEELEMDIKNLSIINEQEYMAQKVQMLRKTRILTDEDWEKYTRAFNEIYPLFCQNIRDYNNLSEGDKRQLVFLKLSFSQKEIAYLMGISYDGVKRARQRLAKKIGLENAGELNTYIESL